MVKRRRRSKKWISWLIFLVLIVAAGAVCYFVWDNYFREKEETVEQGDATAQEEVGEKVEERVEKQNDNIDSDAVVEEKKVVQYDGEDPNEQNELTGAITYAGVSGNVLMVRVNIDQYLVEGSCVLNLTSGGANVYSETVAIVGGPSTATCEGFDVPASVVGSGKFGVEVRLSSGDKTGVISGEVSL